MPEDRIVSIKKMEFEIVKTDENVYRRNPDGTWEELMANSWESILVSSTDELEKMYCEYKRDLAICPT